MAALPYSGAAGSSNAGDGSPSVSTISTVLPYPAAALQAPNRLVVLDATITGTLTGDSFTMVGVLTQPTGG